MDSQHTIPNRHETAIDDDNTRDPNPTQAIGDGVDNPIVTPSQEITSENNNTSGMQTPPMGTRVNASTTDTATPQMLGRF